MAAKFTAATTEHIGWQQSSQLLPQNTDDGRKVHNCCYRAHMMAAKFIAAATEHR